MPGPDYFLTTAGEFEGLAEPRACWQKGRLRNHVRDDYMLIEIKPPLAGQGFGLGDNDIVNIIISTKHKGFSLFPITEWPSHVYVARIIDDAALQTPTFTAKQVELIAWGYLGRTYDEAKAIATKLQQ